MHWQMAMMASLTHHIQIKATRTSISKPSPRHKLKVVDTGAKRRLHYKAWGIVEDLGEEENLSSEDYHFEIMLDNSDLVTFHASFSIPRNGFQHVPILSR